MLHDGKRYDSKALAGVAVGKEFPTRGPLAAPYFRGGEEAVKTKMLALGFTIVKAQTESSFDLPFRSPDRGGMGRDHLSRTWPWRSRLGTRSMPLEPDKF